MKEFKYKIIASINQELQAICLRSIRNAGNFKRSITGEYLKNKLTNKHSFFSDKMNSQYTYYGYLALNLLFKQKIFMV